ncbi:helix-turn-helix domain-containing protein [Psychrobacillus sp. BM2]|uniref:helix-turn-helix domain-containing protein n=1 Tax=Psychrobacillus sp. BM2 TaxID=3400421 RepID=UPI003B0191DC
MLLNEISNEKLHQSIITAINEGISKSFQPFTNKEWLTLSEGAKYAGVSHNTFMKFREMGLKVCQLDGVRRVSKKEIDSFLERNSY